MALPRTSPIRRLIEPFASIKITVTLMAFAMVLVFFATIAQVDTGVWEVQKHYFYTWITYYDFTTGGKFNPDTGAMEPLIRVFRLYMPGGYIVGGGLLLSLSLAPIVHFRLARAKTGIHLIHLGIVILLLGELITGLRSQESQMTISEGRSSNYTEARAPLNPELAIIDITDPARHRVHAIDKSNLRNGYTYNYTDRSRFRVEVVNYYTNAQVAGSAAAGDGFVVPDANAGIARNLSFRPIAYNKRDDGRPPNLPAAIVRIIDQSDEVEREIGKWFCSSAIDVAQGFRIGDRSYEIQLRPRRSYLPYTVTLDDFQFKRYPGSEIARDFSSYVTITDNDDTNGREFRIWMNHPFRKGGYTLFQHQYEQDENTSILLVVKNPVWTWPYVGCAIVTLGMLIQFGLSLNRHINKKATKTATA